MMHSVRFHPKDEIFIIPHRMEEYAFARRAKFQEARRRREEQQQEEERQRQEAEQRRQQEERQRQEAEERQRHEAEQRRQQEAAEAWRVVTDHFAESILDLPVTSVPNFQLIANDENEFEELDLHVSGGMIVLRIRSRASSMGSTTSEEGLASAASSATVETASSADDRSVEVSSVSSSDIVM